MNPNPASIVAWCSFSYAILSAVLSALRPDNPTLPFTVPLNVRVAIATFGGIVTACLEGIVSGTPWLQAVASAALAAVTAFMTHGARTTLPSKSNP